MQPRYSRWAEIDRGAPRPPRHVHHHVRRHVHDTSTTRLMTPVIRAPVKRGRMARPPEVSAEIDELVAKSAAAAADYSEYDRILKIGDAVTELRSAMDAQAPS